MSMQYPRRKPEIMSPAGYWPQLHAAIEAGADSVYFGLDHFSARAKVGFTQQELPEVLRTLHSRGVKGFVTFNTLVFDSELKEAARAIAAIAEAGADAIIIQDFGILRLCRSIAPDLEIHASTQMSITDAAGVRLAQENGAARVTLARELSLAEVRAIGEQTDCELEIFVHGALCVAYSGQCFSSEAWGGRSANRGQCAQACRLPYDMLVDGEHQPLGDARYLLSPGDLYALRHVPEIVEAGIASLKIEGRYKDSEYVALTTAAYRRAVDEAFANQPQSLSPADELKLEQVYSRGLGPFFLSGTDHQKVVRGRAPRHRGVLAGEVTHVSPGAIAIRPSQALQHAPLKAGDGVVFDAASWRDPAEPEEGGSLYGVAPARGGELQISFANGALDFSRIRPGDLVWRTADAEVRRAARIYTEPAAPVRKQPVDVQVVARSGAPLTARWSVRGPFAVSATVESPAPLGTARNQGLTMEALRAQFERLGNTPYELASLDLQAEGAPFAPASLLNSMRREAVERLSGLQASLAPPGARPPDKALHEALAALPAAARAMPPEPRMHLLVRNPHQMEAAIEMAPHSITLDYLDLYGLKPSVERVKQLGIEVRVATPRVVKPGEERILAFLERLDCPLLVRAAGVLHALRHKEHPPLTGDFSLNAANVLSASALLQQGLERITPTHDLNAAQITGLAEQLPPRTLEVIAYGHLPVFHTEHCVFCRFLSNGTSYLDCGRPCEKHQVELRDRSGRAHPVLADVGCRNTVFGAEAQEAAPHLRAWNEAGVADFRLEFAGETAEQVSSITTVFRRYLSGSVTQQQLSREWRRLAPQGTTEGSLFVPLTVLQ